MIDYHCQCGQYLTKYFHTLSQFINSGMRMSGISCPGKDCPITFTLEKDVLPESSVPHIVIHPLPRGGK